MSKTKKVSLAVASFVMAMVLAVAAFALGGFSPMSESKAADRPSVQTLASTNGTVSMFAEKAADKNAEQPSERPSPRARSVSNDTVYVYLIDGDTGEELDYVYMYAGDQLYPSDIPQQYGKYLASIDGPVSDFQEDTEIYLYYKDLPTPEVSFSQDSVHEGDTFEMTATIDYSFANQVHSLDSVYYDYLDLLFMLPGMEAADSYKVEYTYTGGDTYDMTHDWWVDGGDGTVTFATDMESAFVSPWGTVVFPDEIKITTPMKAYVDADLFNDLEDTCSYDEETGSWTLHVISAMAAYDGTSSNMHYGITSSPVDFTVTSGGAHLSVYKYNYEESEQATSTRDYSDGYYYYLDRIPYTIGVVNDGDEPMTDIIVEDVLTNQKWVLADDENKWNRESETVLMPGEAAVFTTNYYVKKEDVARGYIKNTAVVTNAKSVDTGNALDARPSDSCTVPVFESDEHIDVVKEIVNEKDHYDVGDTVEYAVTVTNNTDYTIEKVQFTDYFDHGDLHSGTLDGQPFEWTEYDYNLWTRNDSPRQVDPVAMETENQSDRGNVLENDELHALVIGDMEPGDSAVITATCTVTAEDTLRGDIYNSARATGLIRSYHFESLDYNRAYMITGWGDKLLELDAPSSAISMKKEVVDHASGEPYKVGETIDYKVTVTNTGDLDLYEVLVMDDDAIFDIAGIDNAISDEDGVIAGIAYLPAHESVSFNRSYKTTEYDVGSTFAGEVVAMGSIAPDMETIDAFDVSEIFNDYRDYAHLLWPSLSFEVFDTAEWSATVEAMKTPALNLAIGTNSPVVPGNPIVIDAVVENTSNVTIENVVATDANGNTIEIGTLAPGEKKEVSFKDTADKTYANKITVEGTTAERRVGGNETVKTEKEVSVDVRADKGKLSVTVESDKNGADVKHSFDVVDTDGNKVATLVFTGDSKNMSVDLPFGDYVIKHTGVADGIVKADDVPFTIAPDADEPWNAPVVEKTVTLSNQTGVIEIDNVAGDAECPDATYTVTDEKGNVVAEGVGAGKISELAPGTYIVKVDKVPEGYKPAGDTEKTVTITSNTSGEPTITEEVTFEFTPLEGVKTGTLIIESTTGEEADENNTLSGAEYDLIADEDIVDADGNVLYKKGDKVKTILGEDVKSIKVEIPVGTYKLVEVKAPDGFEPSEEPEKFFDIGEAEIIVNYVNMPTPAAGNPAGDEPQEPSDDGVIPDTGNDEPVIDNGVVSNGGIVSQMGDNAMSILFAGLAAVCLIAGIVILRRKAE